LLESTSQANADWIEQARKMEQFFQNSELKSKAPEFSPKLAQWTQDLRRVGEATFRQWTKQELATLVQVATQGQMRSDLIPRFTMFFSQMNKGERFLESGLQQEVKRLFYLVGPNNPQMSSANLQMSNANPQLVQGLMNTQRLMRANENRKLGVREHTERRDPNDKMERMEQRLDNILRTQLLKKSEGELADFNGLKVNLTSEKLEEIKPFRQFLLHETGRRKWQFLRRTLFNTRNLRKTLDLRKALQIKHSPKFSVWKEQPTQVIRKRLNLKRLRIRMQRKLAAENSSLAGTLPKKLECPVYKCGHRENSESDLVAHYEAAHKDLVTLGLAITKSKKQRQQEKHSRARESALERVGRQDSDSEISEGGESRGILNLGLLHQQKLAEDGKLETQSGEKEEGDKVSEMQPIEARKDSDLAEDSDYQDLVELFNAELEKERAKKMKRVIRRNPRSFEDEDQEKAEELSNEDADSSSVLDPSGLSSKARIKTLKVLIERKQAAKDCQMGAKISNKLVDQVLLASLLHVDYLKELLSKDYEAVLEGEP
jgi:hypothetical protein